LFLTASLTIAIIAALTLWDTHHPEQTVSTPGKSPPISPESPATPVISPFNNTLAYVRWNSDAHPERMDTIRAYEPFFHTLHFSMPNYVPDQPKDFANLTHDSWEVSALGYEAVARTMQVILNTTDDIEGLMFFHFDAWIDPLGFQEMKRDKIWFPDRPNPKFVCINDTNSYKWWGWESLVHEHAKAASSVVFERHKEYVVDANEWCIG
jgi:hypothetical protein